MAAGESEEKNLPPSQRKLRKLREKGQVASSSDFVTALIFAFGIVVVLAMWPRYVEVFTGSMRLALDGTRRTGQGLSSLLLADIARMIFDVLLPLLIVVAAAGFIGHVAFKKGLIVSFDPIKPDMKRLNPTEGFKRIFAFRNGVDFGLVLLRSLVWFITAGVVIWWALPVILMSPTCELPCVATTGLDLIRTLMIIATILLIVIGLIDLPLQTFMFLREQKMSKTEFKREMKEEQGSPEFVGHRKEQHKSFAAGGGITGVRGMTLVFSSSDHVVAIRFDQNSEPVPIIVAKGTGTHGDSILDTAQAMGVPVEVEPMVARELSLVGIGGMVPERLFSPVAMALVRHRKAG